MERTLNRLRNAGVIAGQDGLSSLPWSELRARLARALGTKALSAMDVLNFFRASKRYWAENTTMGLDSFWASALFALYARRVEVQSPGRSYTRQKFAEDLQNMGFEDAQRVNFLRLFVAVSIGRRTQYALEFRRGQDTAIFNPISYTGREIRRPVGPGRVRLFEYTLYSTVDTATWADALRGMMGKVPGLRLILNQQSGGSILVRTTRPERLFYEVLQAGWYGEYYWPDAEHAQERPVYLRDVVARPFIGFT